MKAFNYLLKLKPICFVLVEPEFAARAHKVIERISNH